MNFLENNQPIKESSLDKGFYFQSLFGEACRIHLLEDTQIKRIQLELVELMGKQVVRYTNDESSSVRIETAQQLLQSLTYSIGVYLKAVYDMNKKIELLKTKKMSELFYLGMDEITVLITKSKLLLAKLQKDSLSVDNYAYHDTLFTGIPEFFHDYNIEFGAHGNVGSIDYPLCNTIPNLLGVEYIHEYLSRLTIENNFCKKFSDEKIQMLLQGFSSEAEHVLVNIFELVLTNALGGQLTGRNMISLSISLDDLTLLQNKLEHSSVEDLNKQLNMALEHIAAAFEFDDNTVSYAKEAILQIAFRLKQNLQTKTLIKIWIPFLDPEKREEASFEDGYQMEDDKLRDLIEEVKECRYTSDKLALIQRKVKSLVDLIELLEDCFFEEEYEEVFKLLNSSEIDYLSKVIINDTQYDDLKDVNSRKEWQEKLLGYKNKKDKE